VRFGGGNYFPEPLNAGAIFPKAVPLHWNARQTKEALAKFTIDATALRRGVSRSQLRSADEIRFEMPRACPAVSRCRKLTAYGAPINARLHGAGPWHPPRSAVVDSYKREIPRRKAVALMLCTLNSLFHRE